MTGAGVDAASQSLFERAMAAEDPVYLSVARVTAESLHRRHPDIETESGTVCILRSVLMKPEHEGFVDVLPGGCSVWPAEAPRCMLSILLRRVVGEGEVLGPAGEGW